MEMRFCSHKKTHFYILHTPWKTSPLPFYSGLKSSRGCEISDRTEGTGTANVCAHNKKQTKCHKKDGYRGSTTISLLSKLGVPLYTEVGLSAQIMLLGDSGKALLPDHDKWVGLAFVETFLHLKAVILDLIQPSPSQHTGRKWRVSFVKIEALPCDRPPRSGGGVSALLSASHH